MCGDAALTRRIVSAQCAAPKSARSSRSTHVITVCSRSRRASISATRRGSSGSTGSGRPVVTSQNRHERVQMSPRIMIVSARRVQHSPMFGQLALSHTVWSCSSLTIARSSKYAGLVGSVARIHSGWRRRGAGASPAIGRWTRSAMRMLTKSIAVLRCLLHRLWRGTGPRVLIHDAGRALAVGAHPRAHRSRAARRRSASGAGSRPCRRRRLARATRSGRRRCARAAATRSRSRPTPAYARSSRAAAG